MCHNSAGNAYAHNLVTGEVQNEGPDTRNTPALVPHETDIAAIVRAVNGDHKMYNNVMVGPAGFASFNHDFLPCAGSGNVFLGASPGPSTFETGALVNKSFNAGVTLVEEGGVWFLQISSDPSWAMQQPRALVTTALLGNARLTNQSYTLPDGTPLALTTDYFGRARDVTNPFPGPFEVSGAMMRVQVWPKPTQR